MQNILYAILIFIFLSSCNENHDLSPSYKFSSEFGSVQFKGLTKDSIDTLKSYSPEVFEFKLKQSNSVVTVLPLENNYYFDSSNFKEKFDRRSLFYDFRHRCQKLNEGVSFIVPISINFEKDAYSRCSINYYPSKIDSTEVITYVEYFQQEVTPHGELFIKIKREYKNFDILRDYNWAREWYKNIEVEFQ